MSLILGNTFHIGCGQRVVYRFVGASVHVATFCAHCDQLFADDFEPVGSRG